MQAVALHLAGPPQATEHSMQSVAGLPTPWRMTGLCSSMPPAILVWPYALHACIFFRSCTAPQQMHVLWSPAGLEEVVAAEVSAPQVGAYDVQPGKAGVSFRQVAPGATVCTARGCAVLAPLRAAHYPCLFGASQGSLSGHRVPRQPVAASSHQASDASVAAAGCKQLLLDCFHWCAPASVPSQ